MQASRKQQGATACTHDTVSFLLEARLLLLGLLAEPFPPGAPGPCCPTCTPPTWPTAGSQAGSANANSVQLINGAAVSATHRARTNEQARCDNYNATRAGRYRARLVRARSAVRWQTALREVDFPQRTHSAHPGLRTPPVSGRRKHSSASALRACMTPRPNSLATFLRRMIWLQRPITLNMGMRMPGW